MHLENNLFNNLPNKDLFNQPSTHFCFGMHLSGAQVNHTQSIKSKAPPPTSAMALLHP